MKERTDFLASFDDPAWVDRFVYRGSARWYKVECSVCGRRGGPPARLLDGSPDPRSWVVPCLMGHETCPYCGKVCNVAGIVKHKSHMHPNWRQFEAGELWALRMYRDTYGKAGGV